MATAEITTPSRRGAFKQIAGVIAGSMVAKTAIVGGGAGLLHLMAEEKRYWNLAVVAREKAETACRNAGRRWIEADLAHDPIFAETRRLETAALDLCDRIRKTPAASLDEAIAKLEWRDGDPNVVNSVCDDLRLLAVRA